MLSLFSGLCGLDPGKKITQYTLSSWRSERGLSNNTILAIVQDHDGYIWLGTMEGLVRFDGVNFTVFNGVNTPEFRDHLINNLYVDRQRILWLGTLSGQLLSLERGRFKDHFLDKKIASISNRCIAEDGRGRLWVGTANGLFSRLPGKDMPFEKCLSFPIIKIECLAADRAGRLLVSTADKSLYRLEGQEWRRLLSEINPLGAAISAIGEDRDGNLLLGTDDGFYYFRGKKLLSSFLEPGLSNNITALVEDGDNNLWLGSEKGLIRWQNGKFQYLKKGQGLAGDIIYALCIDAENSLWAGTVDGGLVQIRDEKITALTADEGLKGEVFRSLHDDGRGALWIGGSGVYLNRFQNGRVDNFRLPTRFENINIFSLETDSDSLLWLGTNEGLFRFENDRFKKISLPGQAAHIEIHSILKDASGRLWIGTNGAGLFCREKGKFKQLGKAEGLLESRVSTLFQDREGRLWVGCESGLATRPPGSDEKFITEPFLNHCHVVSFYEDKNGTIWVGTRNQGLKIHKDGRWGSLGSDQGFFDDRAYAILEDDLGYLWFSSERGIFRAKKSELEKAAFDPSLKVSGRLFDENDGMKSRICNYGNPSAWKDGGGRLWFASLNGVVSIDPAHIRKNDRVPPVRIEEVRVDQKNILVPDSGQLQGVKLPAGSQRFEFHYTALSFIRSDKIEFKYKLEGYDREWVAAGNRRQAFYNNLDPGRYDFRVIAANADGVWNTAGASFSFFLRPFIYQTWWFLVLAALAFAVLSGFSWQLLKKYLRAVSFWKKKTHIGHFKILETIGSGGMATIYKAQDTLDRKRIVALKVLKEENFNDENQKKRFKHESLITEQLDHPHIVHIVERGEIDGCWYIAMELLRGQSLAMLIKTNGRLEIAAALEIMLQIVDALKAIHGQNIVHRDLKPENIMVSEERGRRYFVKLLDFGLAITPAQSRLTMSGVVMGTIRYLPPERISDGTSSPAGDIYSAGVILYEMLTGSKPFWSEATGEVIHRILKTYPPAPIEISREIPRQLNALIMAMLDKEPQRRPGLTEIEATLQRLLEKSGPVS